MFCAKTLVKFLPASLIACYIILFGGLTVSFADDKMPTAYNFVFDTIDGDKLPMSSFANKVILVVNTASKCGFTRQYDDLQAIWEKFKDNGLVVLGVPSNDFGSQEPGKEKDIKSFCELNFDVDFPMTSKVSVKGSKAHDFYKWAHEEVGPEKSPKWNFHKYLISSKGLIAGSFESAISPRSDVLIEAIRSELNDVEL